MGQFFAVYHKDTGTLVSVGDFVQDATHCICSHSSLETPGHPIGNSSDGRPLGCEVDGCWHNYAVPTAGVQIARSRTGDVLWQDPGGADAPFVSDPLSADLAALPIADPPDASVMWDPATRTFVPESAPAPPADIEGFLLAAFAALGKQKTRSLLTTYSEVYPALQAGNWMLARGGLADMLTDGVITAAEYAGIVQLLTVHGIPEMAP